MRVSVSRSLNRAERELGSNTDRSRRLLLLLDLINEVTGSTFTAFNLNDELGRVIGGVAHPLTPERVEQIRDLGPTLNALLIASPLHELLWDVGPGVAFAFPQALFRNLQAYAQVYGPMGMHHLAVYQYAPKPDGTRTVVGVSRGDRAFNAAELHALQMVCDRYAKDIDQIAPAGPLLPKNSCVADHRIALDHELRPGILSLYARALVALFYGRLPVGAEGQESLPEALVADLRRYREEHLCAVLPATDGVVYTFTKRHRARLLCLSVEETPEGIWLTVHEDVSQLPRIRRVKTACAALRRDRYAVLAACLAIMEGVRDPKEIARCAGLSALKATSAARLISRAWSIVESEAGP